VKHRLCRVLNVKHRLCRVLDVKHRLCRVLNVKHRLCKVLNVKHRLCKVLNVKHRLCWVLNVKHRLCRVLNVKHRLESRRGNYINSLLAVPRSAKLRSYSTVVVLGDALSGTWRNASGCSHVRKEARSTNGVVTLT